MENQPDDTAKQPSPEPTVPEDEKLPADPVRRFTPDSTRHHRGAVRLVRHGGSPRTLDRPGPGRGLGGTDHAQGIGQGQEGLRGAEPAGQHRRPAGANR